MMIGGPIMGGVSLFKDWGNARVLFDGNSLVDSYPQWGASTAATTAYGALGTIAPISAAVTVGDIGVGGQSINDMRARRAAQVDPYYTAGKKNVLIAWEGTNSICNTGANAGRTGLQAAADMASYISEVRAVHADWYIVLVTTLARQSIPNSIWTTDTANAELLAYDNYLLANYKAMGADAVAHLRFAGSPVYTATFANADFVRMETHMGTDHVHMNDTGYAFVAAQVAQKLKRIRLR